MNITETNELFEAYAEAETERRRLVGICARLTGAPDVAEDLAQEALIEAWRHRDNLRNPQARSAWLAGIAFNVCRRWARSQGRELARRQPMRAEDGAQGLEERLADEFDVEVELERQELAELLDRAMALLPASTRSILMSKYILERPVAEIAEQMGLSEGAIAMRLQRGRLALRRVLNNELSEEAATFGLVQGEEVGWKSTRIWCPLCGRHYLSGYLDREGGFFRMRCTVCNAGPDDYIWSSAYLEPLQQISGFKAAIAWQMAWAHDYYRRALPTMTTFCHGCNSPVMLRRGIPEEASAVWRSRPGLHIRCETCESLSWVGLTGLIRALPQSRAFWRRHPRIRTEHGRELEVGGRAAVETSFVDVAGPGRLDVISDRETFAVLQVHER